MTTTSQPIGVLLACGSGIRFGSHKLLHPLPNSMPMAAASLRNMTKVLSRVIAVVRDGDAELSDLLTSSGAEIVECDRCHAGMAYSIASGVRASPAASGWIIALADMPFINSQTIEAVRTALERGANICIPVHKQQRGHPVGFARQYFPDLVALQGDRGARPIVETHADQINELDCDDPGILIDIDTPSDLSIV
ncbi:MAG: nucleotidyltransferase family protein [Gammaproteobacteria bacterium]